MRGDTDWEWADTGAPDQQLLARARTIAETYEPLIVDSEFDSSLNPQELHLFVSDGIVSESGRFDIVWTEELNYRYHYTEGPDFNYRYDLHPRLDVPDTHFHRPPAASHEDAVASCIEVETVRLVTFAVLQLWRDTLESGTLSFLQQPNPP